MLKPLRYQVPDGVFPVLSDVLRKQLGMTCRQVRSVKFREDGILVNGERSRVSRILVSGDIVTVNLSDDSRVWKGEGQTGPESVRVRPDGRMPAIEDIPGSGSPGIQGAGLSESSILYEDEDLLVIDKPAGICVHPSHGHYGDTLADQVYQRSCALGYHEIPRVIGRLDKDTSGVVLFARNAMAAQRLAGNPAIHKEYLAVVDGFVTLDRFTVSTPIAKDPAYLNRMRVDPDGSLGGKPAVTHGEVLARFREDSERWELPEKPVKSDLSEISGRKMTLVRLWLETGRTHQIRVHMASMGFPLVGDTVYHPAHRQDMGCPEGKNVRAMLHCRSVQLQHPFSGKEMVFQAPVPADLKELTAGKAL